MYQEQSLKLSILKAVKKNENFVLFPESRLFYYDNLDLTLGQNLESFFFNLDSIRCQTSEDYLKSFYFRLEDIIFENNISNLEDFILSFSKLGLKIGVKNTFDFSFFSAIIGSLMDIFQIVQAFNTTMITLFNTLLKSLHKKNFFLELPEYQHNLKLKLFAEDYIYHLTLYNLSINQSKKLNSYPKQFVKIL